MDEMYLSARKVARDRVTPVSMGCPWILGRNSQRKGWPTGRAREKGRRENPALSFSVPLNSSYFLFMSGCKRDKICTYFSERQSSH